MKCLGEGGGGGGKGGQPCFNSQSSHAKERTINWMDGLKCRLCIWV